MCVRKISSAILPGLNISLNTQHHRQKGEKERASVSARISGKLRYNVSNIATHTVESACVFIYKCYFVLVNPFFLSFVNPPPVQML